MPAGDGNQPGAYTDRMRKLYAIAATTAAVLGWLNALYWRDRAGWVTQADIDDMTASAFADALNEPEQDLEHGFGFASAFVVRAANPPHASFPWFAGVSWTDFDTDDDGFRIIHSDSGWCATELAGHELVVAASTPRTRLDDVPEF